MRWTHNFLKLIVNAVPWSLETPWRVSHFVVLAAFEATSSGKAEKQSSAFNSRFAQFFCNGIWGDNVWEQSAVPSLLSTGPRQLSQCVDLPACIIRPVVAKTGENGRNGGSSSEMEREIHTTYRPGSVRELRTRKSAKNMLQCCVWACN